MSGDLSTRLSDGTLKVYTTNGGGMSPIANMAAMQALASTSLTDGATFMMQTDGSLWRYAAASTLTSDSSGSQGPFLVATATTAGVGAFIRIDRDVDLKLPIAFGTTDATVLYTVPTGFRLQVGLAWWEVTTGFTGGTSSAIGIHSGTSASFSTKGDILGGASGDVAATLVSTGAISKGTVGAKNNAPGEILVGADTIVFDRITSAFTAGAGFAHVPVRVVLAPAS